MTVREDREHNIKDFLSRPIIIHTGQWSTSQANETELYTTNFPEKLIANSMYQEKLKGFVGLRATLVIKVQVNSQPFQQGRLMLQYIPYAQYMPNRVALVNATLQGRSGCPRTDLDLSVGTEIEMRMPYVSPHVYYNLITGQGSFGSIYLVVYSQLRDQVSGTGSVEYTVWAHLEDVDIQYPTGANIYTGNDDNRITLGQAIMEGKLNATQLKQAFEDKIYEKKSSIIFAQGMNELTEMRNSGVISSGVGKISEALTDFSKIPYLGNFFSTPAWLTNKMSNILKTLGFSKPTVQAPPVEARVRGQVRMTNYNGVDTSHKLALSACNEIETKAGLAGTQVDEMAIPHIVTIPNYWSRFTWATTDATAKDLWSDYVTPFKIKAYSKTITDRFRATHLGYFANTFCYWRGDLVYTFKFVKTQYHSGRVRISFIPFYYNSTISTGTPDVSRTQKMVVDLRSSTEVSFTVPYVSSRPWMYCHIGTGDGLGANDKYLYNVSTGIVRVEVLNQLVAASSVYQSVDVLVEVSGAPNLTFAGYDSPTYIPYSGEFTAATTVRQADEASAQYDVPFDIGKLPYKVVAGKIVAQGIGDEEAIPRNDAQLGSTPEYAFGKEVRANWSPEAHCIGEKIMSVRQLIKRFGFDADSVLLTTAKPRALIAPFSIRNPVSTIDSTRVISPYEYFYFLYAFWRGSKRFKVLLSEVNSAGDPVTTRPPPYSINHHNSIQKGSLDTMGRFAVGEGALIATSALPNGTKRMGNSLTYVYPNIEGAIEFEVPYYNISHISPATTFKSTDKPIDIEAILKGHMPPQVTTIVPAVSPAEGNKVGFQCVSAAGDDFSFLYLLGVPPLVKVKRAAA